VHLAKFDVPVLVLGETGTGKEVFANLIHGNSPRAAGPKVSLNCAALPADLIESELFGAQRGAYTGSVTSRLGLFRAASGGTLFLDELSEMPAQAQSKLLRTLQDSRVRSLGSDRDEFVDVRIVAAMNVDPAATIKSGKLRADLYHRLAAFTLEIPPLRERPEDLGALAAQFLAAEAKRHKLPVPVLSPEILLDLQTRPWTGNCRELFGWLSRLLLLGTIPDACLDEAALRAVWAEAGNVTQFSEALGVNRDGGRAKLAALGITLKEVA